MFWIKIILQCLDISFTWLNIKHLWVFKMYLVLFTYSKLTCTLLLFSHPVVSDSLGPDGLSMTASLSLTSSQSLPKFLFNASVVALPSHLILWSPLLLLPSIFPSIWDFSIELSVHIRWPKYWSFSFSISPSSDYSGLISLKIDWFDLPAVKGLSGVFSSTTVWRHQFFWHSAFFPVLFSQPYGIPGKVIALTINTFVGRVRPLLFKTPSRFLYCSVFYLTIKLNSLVAN